MVGKPDELKGHVPFALVRVASDEKVNDLSEDILLKEINAKVREGKRLRLACSSTVFMTSMQISVPSQLLMG